MKHTAIGQQQQHQISKQLSTHLYDVPPVFSTGLFHFKITNILHVQEETHDCERIIDKKPKVLSVSSIRIVVSLIDRFSMTSHHKISYSN